MKCEKCGKELVSGAKFCESCGAPVERHICHRCGAPLPGGAKFCEVCGARVPESEPSLPQSRREKTGQSNDGRKPHKFLVVLACILACILVAMIVFFDLIMYDKKKEADIAGQKVQTEDAADRAKTQEEQPESSDYAGDTGGEASEDQTLLDQVQEQYTLSAVEHDGHVYAIFNYKKEGLTSFEECRDFCIRMGGHLAVINSQEENDFLYQLVRDSGLKLAFFGYTDRESEGNWKWVDSTDYGYTNWADGQPNDGAANANGESEDYAEYYKETLDGTWNDAPFGANTWRFICEWEDES